MICVLGSAIIIEAYGKSHATSLFNIKTFGPDLLADIAQRIYMKTDINF